MATAVTATATATASTTPAAQPPPGQPDISHHPDWNQYQARVARRTWTESLPKTLPRGLPEELKGDLVWEGFRPTNQLAGIDIAVSPISRVRLTTAPNNGWWGAELQNANTKWVLKKQSLECTKRSTHDKPAHQPGISLLSMSYVRNVDDLPESPNFHRVWIHRFKVKFSGR